MSTRMREDIASGLENALRENTFQKKGKIYPVVNLKLTSRCNLKCIHCLPYDEGDLSLADIRLIAVRLKEMGARRVSISGGEPFLREDLLKVVDAFSRKGIRSGIFTNGTLLGRAGARKLRDAGVRGIRISLDGPKSAHELVRGRGTYDKTIGAIKSCVNEGLFTTIVTTAMKPNHEKINAVFRLANKLGAAVHVRRYHPLGPDSDRLMLSNQQLDSVMSSVASYYGPDLLDVMLSYLKTVRGWCTAGRRFCIEPNGNVIICPSLRISLGNFRGLRSIWRDVMFTSELCKKIRERQFGGRCSGCRKLEVCGGGCRADAYILKGNALAEDPCCYGRSKYFPILNACMMAACAFYENSL